MVDLTEAFCFFQLFKKAIADSYGLQQWTIV